MDKFLVEKSDDMLGMMQENGVLLPTILLHASIAYVVCVLGWAMAIAVHGSLGFIFAGFAVISIFPTISNINEYQRDIEVFEDNEKVQNRYRNNALLEREAGGFVRIMSLVVLFLTLPALFFDYWPTRILFLVMLTAVFLEYALCAYPRKPNLRQHVPSFV